MRVRWDRPDLLGFREFEFREDSLMLGIPKTKIAARFEVSRQTSYAALRWHLNKESGGK